MSKTQYSENDPTDDEIAEYLDEMYPEPVYVCGMEMTQSYVLKHMDRTAFDMTGSDNMRWYKCDVCDTVYKDDNAEDEAMECCQEYCNECGCDLDEETFSGLCLHCEMTEDEDEDIDTESTEPTEEE